MPTTQRHLSTTLLIAFLIAILVSAPLYLDSTRDRDWGVGLFILLIGCAGLLWGFTLITQSRQKAFSRLIEAKWAVGLIVLFQFWVLIQLVFGISVDLAATLQSLLLGLAYTLFFTMVICIFHTRKRLTILVAAIVATATLQAAYGSLMVLSGIEWLLIGPKTEAINASTGVATGTFYNRNHLAGFLEMALGLGIGLLLALPKNTGTSTKDIIALLTSQKAILRLCLVIMVIGLVMSRSRMGNTAFFISLIGIGLLYTWFDIAHRKRNLIILASIMVIDVVVISQFFGLEKLIDRIQSTQVVINTQSTIENTPKQKSNAEKAADMQRSFAIEREARDNIGEYAWKQFLDRPFSGFGAGTFNSSFQQYPELDAIQVDQAHNDHLQHLIEFGLIGYAILASLVSLLLYQLVKTVKRNPSHYYGGLAFGSLIAISSITIHSLTDFNLQLPANALLFITCLAIAQTLYQKRKDVD